MEHLTIPERPKFVSYDSSETVVSASVAFIEDLEAQHTKVHKIDDFNEHHDSDAESIITIGNDATHDEKKEKTEKIQPTVDELTFDN